MLNLNSVLLEGQVIARDDVGTLENPVFELTIRTNTHSDPGIDDDYDAERVGNFKTIHATALIANPKLAESIRNKENLIGSYVRIVGRLSIANEVLVIVPEHVEIRQKRGIQMEYVDAKA